MGVELGYGEARGFVRAKFSTIKSYFGVSKF